MFVIPPLGQVLRKDAMLTQVVPTVVVFIVLAIFAFVSWQNTQNTIELQRDRVIDEKVSNVENTISERLRSVSKYLRAGAALHYSSRDVTRSEWSRFYRTLITKDQQVDISKIVYAPVVSARELSEFEQQTSFELNQQYKVYPIGNRAIYVPALYHIQFADADTTVLGYDLYSDESRRKAIFRARDSGQLAVSQTVPLLGIEGKGMTLFMPVYAKSKPTDTVAQRRAAIMGYVYASIITDQIFANLLSEDKENFGFVVSEHGDDATSVVYESELTSGIRDQQNPVATSVIELYGHRWDIRFFATPNIVSPDENARPGSVLLTGLVLATVVSLAVFLLIKYRTRMFAMAEEHKLQQAKDELLSLASHQLRTPATGVKQYVGMVLDGFGGSVPEQQAKLLEQAYKSNERQLQIINEFLYVAKLGSGSLTTTKHDFDLAALVRDVVDEMMIEVEENKHKLRLKVPASMTVKADEHSIRMIVENLVSNAIKYTLPGGRIFVEVRATGKDAIVRVEDSGVGIKKRDQRHLFKQFSRIQNELSSEVSGSGIGLYLSQQLAQRNGGKITVQSESGNGATFTLHLPTSVIRRVKNITKIRQKS